MNIHKKTGMAFLILIFLSGTFFQITVKAEDVCQEEFRFQAWVEWSNQGWIVKGTLEDVPSDACLIRPMCSADGVTYQDCGQEWDLTGLNSEDKDAEEKLKNQRCLFDSEEPLKSYLAKELDRFYIKLRIVREGGAVCETNEAVIDRGEQKPLPEGVDLTAKFAPKVSVREGRPPKIKYYGRYQITVREDASGEEILSYLPDTLPVEIQIYSGSDYIGSDILDCPVQWKTLSLPELIPGESVAVLDAAEEISVPAGTVVHTQRGIFKLSEPVGINQWGLSDEVNLMLNVVAKDGEPKGALVEENDGLEVVFHLKPTGASSIRVYTISEGESEWRELAGLSLVEAVDAQPSTANSGYALVLGKEQEPYWSYRMAREAGEEPSPFFVGLKIEGGVYDGRELILSWPDTYELPLALPKLGGAGGNENNAGASDKGDSTQGGQRPVLPGEPEDVQPGEPEDEQPGGQEESSPKEPEKETPKRPVQGESSVIKAEVQKTETMEREMPKKESLEKKTLKKELRKAETLQNEISDKESVKKEPVKNKAPSQTGEKALGQKEKAASPQEEETVSDRAGLKSGSGTAMAFAGEEGGSAQPDKSRIEDQEVKGAGKRMAIPVVLGISALCIGAGYFLKRRYFRKQKQ